MLYVHLSTLDKVQAYSLETNSASLQRGCYIRTMTVRVQLKKKSLVVILKGLGAKTDRWAVNRQSQRYSDSVGCHITLTLT
jgi:hypothetical protein